MIKPTVLLTGATGFLGSHLLESLLDHDYPVVALKRSMSSCWRIGKLLSRCKYYDIDLISIEQVFDNETIDCVIHTACHYGRNGDLVEKIVQSNLMFGLQVLEQAQASGTNLFINTDSLLPRKISSYSLSKKQFVDWLEMLSINIQVINLKIEHMYGPKDDEVKFVSWVISQFEVGKKKIALTSGNQERDFIYIDDVVSAYLTVLENSSKLERFREFEVGTGCVTKVKDFLEKLKNIYESTHGLSGTKFMFGAIAQRDGELMSINVNNEGLKELGWSPEVEIDVGLQYIIGGKV